jgi:predicted Zn-dependent protease
VDFFERIEALEQRKPGSIAKVFATHPMTNGRIKAAQEEIEKDLKPQAEYVVNTSEFQKVKGRLAMLHESA